jgi:hypothetical protein
VSPSRKRAAKNRDDVSELRIPVTAGQKQIVADAMAVDGREFASWARGSAKVSGTFSAVSQ